MALKDFGMYYDLRNMSADMMNRLAESEKERAEKEANANIEKASADWSNHIRKLCFEVSSECNLNCAVCFRQTWINEKQGLMDKALFDKVMADTAVTDTVRTVFFGGMGEPLMHPDIVEMVRAAAALDKHVELITNATLLTKEMSRALLEAGLTKLWVSVDGFSKEYYEDAREGASYEDVFANIARFNITRAEIAPSCELGLAFVATTKNITEMQHLVNFCIGMNVSDVNISNAIPTSPQDIEHSLFQRLLNIGYGSNTDKRRIKYSMPLMEFTRRDVQDAYSVILEQDSRTDIMGQQVKRRVNYCKFVAEGAVYVRWDGDVTPCMGLLHSSTVYLNRERVVMYHHSFGNVAEQALSDIWESEEFSDFRDRVKSFTFSPCTACGGCALRADNTADCIGNEAPTCGVCLWAEGFFNCP